MTGAPQFIPDLQSPHVDPLQPTHEDFDYDAIDRELEQLPTDERKKMAELLRRILIWMVDVNLNKENALNIVGRRTVAFAWTLDPGLLQDAPSLRTLAKKIGLSPYPVAKLTGEVTRQFGIENRAAAHAWNKKREVQNAT